MIVLDTHVLVWWLGGDKRLSRAAARAIRGAQADENIVVSGISAWELATLVVRGRVQLTLDAGDWLARAAAIDGVRFQPVDNAIAVESVVLPGEFHRDPADRIIVATARKLDASLVTADEKIRSYAHVRTIW